MTARLAQGAENEMLGTAVKGRGPDGAHTQQGGWGRGPEKPRSEDGGVGSGNTLGRARAPEVPSGCGWGSRAPSGDLSASVAGTGLGRRGAAPRLPWSRRGRRRASSRACGPGQ